jgi:hypothetical protein
MSTFKNLLRRAEQTYESVDLDANVATLPVSLDQRKRSIIDLQNKRVDHEAEIARIDDQIKAHQIALAKEMLDLGIPSPLAEAPPAIPEKE